MSIPEQIDVACLVFNQILYLGRPSRQVSGGRDRVDGAKDLFPCARIDKRLVDRIIARVSLALHHNSTSQTMTSVRTDPNSHNIDTD